MVCSEFHLAHGVYPLAFITEHDKAAMGSSREELEVLDDSEPESRAACSSSREIPCLRVKLQTSETLSYGYPGRN